MIYSATGCEIPKLFVEVFENTFDLNFERYIAAEGRGFIALELSKDHPEGLLVARCGLDEGRATVLSGEAIKLGFPDALGAYFTPSRFQISPLKDDVLVIAQRWLNLDNRDRTAIAYHEACHCIRDSKIFSDFESESVELSKARKLRKFTQYAYNDELGHDDQWFALIVARAQNLQSAYPKMFSSIWDVVVTALNGDIDSQALLEEAPDLLEGMP